MSRWSSSNGFRLKGRDSSNSGFGHAIDINGNLRISGDRYKGLFDGKWGQMPKGSIVEANGTSWVVRASRLRSFDGSVSYWLPVKSVDSLSMDAAGTPNALISDGKVWIQERGRWQRISSPEGGLLCAYHRGIAAVATGTRLSIYRRLANGKWAATELPVSMPLELYISGERVILVESFKVSKYLGSRATTIFEGSACVACLYRNRLFVGGVGGTVDVLPL